MTRTKIGEWMRLVISLCLVASCACEGGWTPYHTSPARHSSTIGRRLRNVAPPLHSSHQRHYDSPSYGLYPNQGSPLDLSYYATNNRQGHSISPPRFNTHLSHSSIYHGSPDNHYRSASYSSVSGIPELNGVSHTPVIVTSDHGLFDDDPYSPHSIVTASPLSLGPSHAGFLSAGSSLRVSDHFSKPSISKGYRVKEDEQDDDTHRAGQVISVPLFKHRDHHHRPSPSIHRSSPHSHDSKATSFQSFILHNTEPVKVYPKNHDDHSADETESNEISHKH